MRNQYEMKVKLQKKAYRIIFVRNINFFIARSPFCYIIRYYLCLLPPFFQVTNLLNGPYNPVDTRRRFNVYTTSETSYRRLIDVKTTSCVYWESQLGYEIGQSITWETLFLRNHTQNMVETYFTDPFVKNKKWENLWINSIKFYTDCFFCIPSWGLSKYFETKLHTNCFYFI